MGKKKKRNKNTLTRHHIMPSSRSKRREVQHPDNIAMIKDKHHKAYHIMFSNMTPDEIIKHLVTHYWNNQWGWVAKAIVNQELDDDNGKW